MDGLLTFAPDVSKWLKPAIMVRLELPPANERQLYQLDQPFPKVDPACDLPALLVELEASFAPACDSAAFDGFALFPMVLLLSLGLPFAGIAVSRDD